MSKFVLALSFVFLAICSVVVAHAAPLAFGIEKNMLPSTIGCEPIYQKTKMDDTGQYACKSLPNGSPVFDQYIVAFVRGLGICNVTAVTPYIFDDQRGKATQRVFQRIVVEMAQQYGEPDERVDHAASAADAAAESFQTAIVAEGRQVFDQWNDLKAVSLKLESASVAISGSAELGLAVFSVVRFPGTDQCTERLEAESSNGNG